MAGGLDYADLELSLRAVDAGEGRFAAELRLLLPGGAAEARLLGAPPPVVHLDPGPLLGLRADPAAYGALLSERLFADLRLREGVARARAAAAGAGAALRLRLRLDPAAAPCTAWPGRRCRIRTAGASSSPASASCPLATSTRPT